MNPEALERRVQRLEDLEAIRDLKARYAAACDNGYDADTLAAMFTEDAVWDGATLGRHVRREAIRAFFQGSSSRISFARHHVSNPLIEIDGDTATGTWYLLQTCTYIRDNQAVWGAGTYRDRYVRTAEGWRFSQVRLESHFWTPYEAGWAKVTFIQRG